MYMPNSHRQARKIKKLQRQIIMTVTEFWSTVAKPKPDANELFALTRKYHGYRCSLGCIAHVGWGLSQRGAM